MPIHSPCRATAAAHALVAAAMLAVAGTALAGDYIVTTPADSGPGSLRQILTDLPATEPNSIRFQPGATGNVVIAVDSALPPLRGTHVTIDGEYTLGRIIVDGQGAHRLFVTNGMPTTLRNLTIRNGAGGLNAGCVQASGSVSLEQVTIEGCRSGIESGNAYGGGVSGHGTLVVRRSVFRDNLALSGLGGGNQAGGAIYFSGDLLVEQSVFEGNRAAQGPNAFSDGGAIQLYNGILTVRQSRFVGNAVAAPSNGGGTGGAIACSRSDCLVEFSSFHGNTATHGGAAIFASASHLTLRNAVVQDNVGRYGAVAVRGLPERAVTATIDNSSFVDNAVTAWTGFGAQLDLMGEATAARIANTVFSDTHADGGPLCGLSFGATGYVGTGYNRATDTSCVALMGMDSLVVTADELGLGAPVPAGYIDLPSLARDSVLIDAGNPAPPGSAAATCLIVDAVGTPRPRDGNGDGYALCDIGAQERLLVEVFEDGFEGD